MYKIMLVEDEWAVRNGIESTINWADYDFEPIVACKDGVEAMKVISSGFLPDLVLTDICMPNMGGLEFAKYLADYHPEAMVIIISGYDDFSYAREALKLKVFDYVLKPVTGNELRRIIANAKEELDNKQTIIQVYHAMQDDIQNAAVELRSRFLETLINQPMDAETIRIRCEKHQVYFKHPYLCVAIIEMDSPDYVSGACENTPVDVLQYAVFNITEEILNRHTDYVCFESSHGRSVIIASGEDPASLIENMKHICKEISTLVEDKLEFTVSAGIGEIVPDIADLFKSTTAAEGAIKYRFINGHSSVLYSGELPSSTSHIDTTSYERDMVAAIKNLDEPAILAPVDGLFHALRENKLPVERCIYYVQKMMMTLADIVEEISDNTAMQFLNDTFASVDIFHLRSLEEARLCIIDLCQKTLAYTKTIKNSSNRSIVLSAEQYIKDNYQKSNLSLVTISSYLSVSVSHFSFLFKNHTGKTFLEYLNSYRMEKAKELLRVTDKRIYEVANSLGFSDAHYFSIVFKRMSGMSPKEYQLSFTQNGKKDS